MFRFLLTPRWIGLLVVVVALGGVCVKLSQWQFHRYAERQQGNTRVRDNLAARPVPFDRLMSRSGEPSSAVEWRRVTVTGRYDVQRQVAVLYRTRNGAPGIEVVTPLRAASGAAVLVDRGWVASAANGNQQQRMPAPATGVVRVTGWVRADSTGGSSEVTVSQGSVRGISAPAIGQILPYPLYDGFVQLTDEQPRSPRAPIPAGPPDLSSGPSYFYGWQWLFFALLFFGFWGYFAWAEYQEKTRGGRPRSRGGSRRTAAAETSDVDSLPTRQTSDASASSTAPG